MEERRILSVLTVLENDVKRLVVAYLAKQGSPNRLIGELTRLVAAALGVPPDSTEKLEAELSRYEEGGKQELLKGALTEFLESLPPAAEQLFTEQRNGTGTLMSQLRHAVEEERNRQDQHQGGRRGTKLK